MFIKILQEQLKAYEEEFVFLKHKGNIILEFASYPLLDKSIKINNSQRKNLQNIIKKNRNNYQNLG